MQTTTELIISTHKAAKDLRAASDKTIKTALLSLADALEAESKSILAANKKDLAKQDPANERNDRLMLNEERIKNIANSIRKVSRLPNPSGKVLTKYTLDNGLKLHKIAVPLGVAAAVYESRPNVTFDIAALCLRSQNGCVLKGSSEAEHTNLASVRLIKKVLKQSGINPDCVTLLSSARETVNKLFTATKYIDVLIPRGSDGLIQFVRKNSLVPVIETGAGVCHVYVEKEANLKKAVQIAYNAKVSRPSVCNAMDTLLIDAAVAKDLLTQLAPLLEASKVEIFADNKAQAILKKYPYLQPATEADYSREFLSLKCAVKIVKGIDEALEHISKYSTKHSEAIVSQNKQHCKRFLQEVDAAAVYTNASTRFTDGEEFGLGAEIGISTQKLHARGPFALEKLVTEKWLLEGNGQIR